MNSEEFIQTCSSMGYSSKKLAKKYVEKNQKDAYDMDDIINVHRKSGNFKGNHTCGLSSIPNGKTTAFQNAQGGQHGLFKVSQELQEKVGERTG